MPSGTRAEGLERINGRHETNRKGGGRDLS